jgi:hypothetical protein
MRCGCVLGVGSSGKVQSDSGQVCGGVHVILRGNASSGTANIWAAPGSLLIWLPEAALKQTALQQ